MKIKVGVVGYGTIGKRVADAVLLQDDMELVGVTAHSYNYRVAIAAERGIKIFAVDGERESLEAHGISVAGSFDDLLENVDVVVDATPKKQGAENKKIYEAKGVKAIFQGGEKASVADVSFVAQANYSAALNKQFVRVVSCNTTALTRTIHALDQKWGVKRARATLVRRAMDPAASRGGPLNAIEPTFELPSHHGPDVRTVLPNVEVFTTAIIAPTTLMHMHVLSVKLEKDAAVEEVIDLFRNTTRVRVIPVDQKIITTAQVMELARDLGNKRGDMMEICVWDKGIGIYDDELFFMQAVHQESDVVPENIDAIRAVMGFEDAEKSIEMTNKSLGLK
ncbi:type II glyceraldehyde-3-phosphate dehydrogenase [Candidatus Woesearchaeota archaeon]|nr:MAG: type II glyceraldehyde-3-phosphate dehydrogenase [Candidatus Woesearchaeota archaeon]